jgi:esterase/lipase
VIVAGSKLGSKISSIVAWTPGIIKDRPKVEGEYMYEQSQRVRWSYWLEAHEANVIKSFGKLSQQTFIFFATKDEYVPLEDQQEIIKIARPDQRIEVLEGEAHSKWQYKVAQDVIEKTANFLVLNFK